MTGGKCPCAVPRGDGRSAGALEGALLGVRGRRTAQAIMERHKDILALSQSLGEALSADRYLCHREAQHLLAATALMAELDVLDVEQVIGSLKAPLQEAVRQIVALSAADGFLPMKA